MGPYPNAPAFKHQCERFDDLGHVGDVAQTLDCGVLLCIIFQFILMKSQIKTCLYFGALALMATNAFAQQSADDAAKKIAANAGCFTCHTIKHVDSKDSVLPVGPSWQDVANQYRGKPGAADFLTRIVLEGSNPYSSHWKNKAAGIAMPPNAVAISESNARQVVYWILSLN